MSRCYSPFITKPSFRQRLFAGSLLSLFSYCDDASSPFCHARCKIHQETVFIYCDDASSPSCYTTSTLQNPCQLSRDAIYLFQFPISGSIMITLRRDTPSRHTISTHHLDTPSRHILTLHAVEVCIPHPTVQQHLGKIALTNSEMTDKTTGERIHLTIAIPTTSH